ncbi:MAG TPA: hypothetical protein VKE41_23920 [Roseiflexaceae bacterium]|nr:hypothetical protein [Roseiflexaceae bacterium]
MTKQPMIGNKLAKRFAWSFCALVALATIWLIANEALNSTPRSSLLAILTHASWPLIPLAFAALGALVISRQPHNTIGWLMLAPALAIVLDAFITPLVSNVTRPPAEPSWLFLVAVWANQISSVLAVYPILLILLLFPTGHPPSRRWNGLVLALVSLLMLNLLVVSFGRQLWAFSEAWSVANPIGFIPDEWVRALYLELLQVVLGVLALLCTASLFVRYKHGSVVEKTQIKWIAFASSIFGLLYLVTIVTLVATGLGWASDDPVALAVQLPAGLTGITIPVTIAIAILRHHLFDIDIIIRRTLVYSTLTLTLGLVYVGCILLSRMLVAPYTSGSELAIVASTLAIAALFNPLRRRILNFIDRRFYRRKYDAAKVLAAFGATARDETDLEQLTAEMLRVVETTLQPEFVGLWLHDPQARSGTEAARPDSARPR